jgi:hypothetical protein
VAQAVDDGGVERADDAGLGARAVGEDGDDDRVGLLGEQLPTGASQAIRAGCRRGDRVPLLRGQCDQLGGGLPGRPAVQLDELLLAGTNRLVHRRPPRSGSGAVVRCRLSDWTDTVALMRSTRPSSLFIESSVEVRSVQ